MEYEPLVRHWHSAQPLVAAFLHVCLLYLLRLRCGGQKVLPQCDPKVLVICRLKRNPSPSRKTSPGSDTMFQFTYNPLTLLSSLRKLILVSSSMMSPALPVYIHPPRYQPKTPATTPTSPDEIFAPLASAGTVSEFTISAYEKPLESESLPRIPAGSLSSRASSKSLVDYAV